MDDKRASQDALNDNPSPRRMPDPAEERPQLLKGWDYLWERITRLGLGDVALRVGSAMVTVALIGLIIWVMKGFFLGGEMSMNAAAPLQFGGSEEEGIPLPSYAGSAPIEGLSRSVETHTDADSPSRYEFIEYEVQTGDSIYAIAEKFGLTPSTILFCNYNTLYDNPAFISPGEVLQIPPTDGVLYTWNEGDGLNGVAKGLNVTPEAIINWPANNLSADTIGDFAHPNIAAGTQIFAPAGTKVFTDWTTALFTRDEAATSSSLWGQGKCAAVVGGFTGTGTYEWPTSDHYISGYEYSPETNHWGIDIGGKTGNPIYATDSGVVVYAGWNDVGYGNVIAIDHGENADGKTVQSVYAHLSSIAVGCGTSVYQGDIIGYMGSTGRSTGPHLHFELIIGSFKANPHAYLGE